MKYTILQYEGNGCDRCVMGSVSTVAYACDVGFAIALVEYHASKVEICLLLSFPV